MPVTSLRRRVVPALVIASALTASVAALPSSAAAPDCAPARAAGLSYLLDGLQTGSAVGPGVMYGIVTTVAGRPLPGPAGTAQNQLINAGANAVRTMSTAGPAQINNLRTQVEFIAVYNSYANAFMEMGADQMDAGATQFGEAIQPFDTTAHEMATIFRQNEEESRACDNTPPAKITGVTPTGRVGLAFVLGQSQKATALIKQYKMVGHSAQLGQAVYLGGIAAVTTKRFDEFRTAVAYAFPHSGTSMVTASQAFQAAATKAAQNGLTATMGAVGGRTVTETYQAYLAGA